MRAGRHDALLSALGSRRVLVVCGSGGVGKTTTAAALGLAAARAGRRTLVCTIDPSRRLATSLGLDALTERPRELDLGKVAPRSRGELHAMTLDTKRTFDALVERYSPDPASRDRILKNRFYREVSAALAGSHEYMAMEKLLELSGDPRFDLVILDTPPTRHALDFLEAPDRLLGFLDVGVLRYFLKPYFAAGRLTLRVATRTGAAALRIADRFLGLDFLQDLSEFFLAFESMYSGFKERAGRVHALVRDPSSGFVLVASPQAPTLDEALYFWKRLKEKQMPFIGFVVNRLRPLSGRSVATKPCETLPADFAERLLGVFQEQQSMARLERRSVARLEVDAKEPLVLVPEFEGDVHDLRGLRDVADALVGPRDGRSAA